MRRSPLKRTPFKRKEPSYSREPHPLMLEAGDLALIAPTFPRIQSSRKGVYGGTTQAAILKHDYIRSPALMRAYRLIPCQNCGKDDGTVCGAHSNWGEHGKGKSIKADDNRCASLCFTCHGMLDQGSVLGKAERYALWSVAHQKTVRELVARGLWPQGVAIPKTEAT